MPRDAETAEVMTAYAADAPEVVKRELSPFLPDVLRELARRAVKGSRFHTRLFFELLKLVGAQAQVTINLWQQLGAKDEGHAKRLMDTALEAEGMDELSALALSESWARSVRERHGMPALIESPHGTSLATVIDESPS